MSGIETAGIILSTFPLLIESYDRVIQPFRRYRKFSSNFEIFHDEYEAERTIFRTECVLLLVAASGTRTFAMR